MRKRVVGAEIQYRRPRSYRVVSETCGKDVISRLPVPYRNAQTYLSVGSHGGHVRAVRLRDRARHPAGRSGRRVCVCTSIGISLPPTTPAGRVACVRTNRTIYINKQLGAARIRMSLNGPGVGTIFSNFLGRATRRVFTTCGAYTRIYIYVRIRARIQNGYREDDKYTICTLVSREDVVGGRARILRNAIPPPSPGKTRLKIGIFRGHWFTYWENHVMWFSVFGTIESLRDAFRSKKTRDLTGPFRFDFGFGRVYTIEVIMFCSSNGLGNGAGKNRAREKSPYSHGVVYMYVRPVGNKSLDRARNANRVRRVRGHISQVGRARRPQSISIRRGDPNRYTIHIHIYTYT